MRTVVFRFLLFLVSRFHGLGPRFVWDPDVLAAMNGHTRRAYVRALKRLEEWLHGRLLTDGRLAAYLLHLAGRGLSASSAVQVLSAVRNFAEHHGVPSPDGPRTVAALKRIKLTCADCGQGQVPSATAEDVDAIVRTAGEPRTHANGRRESPRHAERRGLLELALIAVLFMGALRVSEAAALRWRDVTMAGDGQGVHIWVRRSKANPYGAESDVRFVKGVLAGALVRLREAVGGDGVGDGRVFGGLTAATLSRRVAAMAKAAGIAKRLTGHSFRIGLAVELTRLGASLQEVMHAGGWKTAAMVAHYSAAARAEGGAVAKYL